MPTLNPVFLRKPFTRVALTNSINRTVRRKKVFDTLFNWNVDRAPVDRVQVNIGNDNTVGMVPTTPRGGVPPVIGGDKREAAEIMIPGFAGRSTVLNSEAFGVISGLEGDDIDVSLQSLIDGRNAKIINTIENSLEHSRAGVFRNKILDKNGKVILDYKKQFGMEQGQFAFDLSGGKKIAPQLERAKDAVREVLGDDVASGFKLLVGKEVYWKLSENNEYRAAATAQGAIRLTQDDLTDGVVIAGVRIIPIFSPNWGPNECKLVPDIEGACQKIYGRSTASQYWGTVLPFYTTTEPVPHDEGIEMQTWSFCLHYFQRPEAILDCTFAF